jgi:cytochrome c-type biogenesis protein CcmH
MRALVAALLILLFASPAFAVNPGEALDDPALEARARAISAELRCLVCQNQSIDLSDADLAHELRLVVRERLLAGDTDAEVQDYVVARYGEFVLLRPVFAPHTLVLWIAAPALLIAGLIAVIVGARRRRQAVAADEPAPLSAEERHALDSLKGP